MFYYYGAKNRLAKKYPEPIHNVIVEPFAGSAAYAQYWRKKVRQVLLIDADENVVWLWNRLISMSQDEINSIERPIIGKKYDDRLIDLLIKSAAASNGVSRMTGSLACPSRVLSIWDGMIRRIADRVDDCRGWHVVHGDYRDAPMLIEKLFGVHSATWFVDPPYEVRRTNQNSRTAMLHGDGYRKRDVHYGALAEWCRLLDGQVIVCEQNGASWLPFTSLDISHQDSQGKLKHEVIWTNNQ